jgi:hypothetical protein
VYSDHKSPGEILFPAKQLPAALKPLIAHGARMLAIIITSNSDVGCEMLKFLKLSRSQLWYLDHVMGQGCKS